MWNLLFIYLVGTHFRGLRQWTREDREPRLVDKMDSKGAQMLVALITPSRPRPGLNEVILSFINLLPQENLSKLQEQNQDHP
jgi:hypothetical protein